MSLGVHGSPQPVAGCHPCDARYNLTTKKRLISKHTYDFPLNPHSLTFSPQNQDLLPSSIHPPSTTIPPSLIHTSNTHPPTAPPKRQKYIPPPQFSPGELGKLATHMASVLAFKGWEIFFRNSPCANPPSTHTSDTYLIRPPRTCIGSRPLGYQLPRLPTLVASTERCSSHARSTSICTFSARKLPT